MQRSWLVGSGILLLLSGMAFLGCGGGKAVGPTVNITLSPSDVSLTRGAMFQITAQAEDANHNTLATPTLAYHCVQLPSQTACSPNSPISVSSSGLVCAGQWDANAVRCYACSNPDAVSNQCPANGAIPLPLGAASITATATVNDQTVTSSAVVVTDHWPIDSVEVCSVDPNTLSRTCPAPLGSCISQNLTAQYAAEAFSKDPAACQNITGSSTTPCQIPDGTQPGTTNTIGSIDWLVSPGQVGTADAGTHVPSEPVTVTASTPGQGVVTASIGAAGASVSGSTPFNTCRVANIHVQQQNTPAAGDTETFFTAPVSSTVQLVANVTDTHGTLLTSTVALSWFTSQPALASVSLGSVNTASPGTAEITAACLPPTCNINLNLPIFADDVVTAHITGTPDSTVLATTSAPPPSTTTSNFIVPIDTVTNNPGAAFTLPANLQVNSMVMTPQGDPAFLGTTCTSGTTTGPNGAACSGLLRFDPTTTTVASPATTLTGTVLATDGIRVVLSDPTNSQTIIATAGGPGLEKILPIPNATAAAFAIDGSKIYIVGGNNLYIYDPGLPLRFIALPPPASNFPQSVAFFATGAMAYVADAAGDQVVAACNDAPQSADTAAGGSPMQIAAIPNATGMVAADSPNIDEIDVTSNGACPPVIMPTPPLITHNTFPGVSNFTARQLLMSNDSSLAVILSNQNVLVYNLGSKQTSAITLSGGATPLSGGLTPDSATLYVGGSDGTIHRVDLTKTPPVDAQSIAVSLCPAGTPNCIPNFVVVRPVATVATLSSLTIAPLNPITGVSGAPQNCPVGTPAGEVCFTATGRFSDNTTRDMTNFVAWTSSNTVVAIIGANASVIPPLTPGQARALAIGTSTITAASGGVSASTTLTVQ